MHIMLSIPCDCNHLDPLQLFFGSFFLKKINMPLYFQNATLYVGWQQLNDRIYSSKICNFLSISVLELKK